MAFADAAWDIERAVIPMPQFSVIYIKRTDRTPRTTTITYTFPYIPFYIARYEEAISSEGAVNQAIEDLTYFRDEMIRMQQQNELSDNELIDLKGFVNTIITHITNGNKNEERLVNVMGGTIIETESERLIRLGMCQGEAKMIIEMGQEYGLDDVAILKRIQEKVGLSLEDAKSCLNKYGKQFV